MKTRLRPLLSSLLASLLLAACASGPPPPDWQANAFSALNGFTSAYLSGDTRLAELELSRAKQELSRTGQADLMARAELTRCAAQVASLELAPCRAFGPLAADAGLQAQAYAGFLSGQLAGWHPDLLPPQYRALVVVAANPPETGVLQTVNDPLSRLIAAGVLLQRGQITPPDIALATETASAQGWRRPLLAWLGLQRERAQAAGDAVAVAALQRRIDLVAPAAATPP